MLIDSHAHIYDLENKEQIIANMQNDNLNAIVSVAYNLHSSQESVSLANLHDNIFAVVGVHPNYSDTVNVNYLNDLRAIVSKNEKVKAIGEIGLDYYRDRDKSVQQRVFVEQIELAQELNKHIMLHVRDSYTDVLKIIKTYSQEFISEKRNIIVHCFSGNLEQAQQFIALGCYLSFSGIITFKNAKEAPIILRSIPKDKVLLETDCPYLAPMPHRGETNQPRYINYIAQKLADIWQQDIKIVEEITTANTKKALSLC